MVGLCCTPADIEKLNIFCIKKIYSKKSLKSVKKVLTMENIFGKIVFADAVQKEPCNHGSQKESPQAILYSVQENSRMWSAAHRVGPGARTLIIEQ